MRGHHLFLFGVGALLFPLAWVALLGMLDLLHVVSVGDGLLLRRATAAMSPLDLVQALPHLEKCALCR